MWQVCGWRGTRCGNIACDLLGLLQVVSFLIAVRNFVYLPHNSEFHLISFSFVDFKSFNLLL